MTTVPLTSDGQAHRLYATPGARRRAVAAWCLFDFANSSYATLIITVVFAVYFREAIVAATDNRADQLWGLANFCAMLIVAVVSPVLGAVADESGRKKLFLVLTTLQTVTATALLFYATPGRTLLAMMLYVVATVGFESGYVFYNAFLHDVSTESTIGRVSGWGWAVGYGGGLTALGLCSPWIASELVDTSGKLIDAAVMDRRIAFVIVAAFYLVFALPAFAWLRSRGRQPPSASLWSLASRGFGRVYRTLRHLRAHKEVAKFVVASLFFTDGITTVIVFSATYATVTFGFTPGDLVMLFLVMNVVAVPSTVLAGYLADALGAKRTLILSLLLWIAVVLTAFAATGRGAFWAMSVGVAVGMGSVQAVARSFMAQLCPPARAAEFFGFYVMSGKLASVSGPLVFGTVSAWTGSQRLAVLSLLPLFVVGLLLTSRVDVARSPEPAPRPAVD